MSRPKGVTARASMLPSIVELELWALPGTALSPVDGKTVAERCMSETGLGPMVVLGLNFVPDAIDAQNLKSALAAGELRHTDFAAFCKPRGLDPDPNNERSAAEFLAFAEGQALAWLHLPAEQSGLVIAQTLVAWVKCNGMELRDGASTYEPLNEDQISALWQQ